MITCQWLYLELCILSGVIYYKAVNSRQRTKEMELKNYKTIRGIAYEEAQYFSEQLLRNLEIRAHEVKCRKPCG